MKSLIRALDVGLDSHWPVELVELVELASRTCFGGVVLPPTQPAVVDPVELADVAIHPLAVELVEPASRT
jgi:hypothetical protein